QGKQLHQSFDGQVVILISVVGNRKAELHPQAIRKISDANGEVLNRRSEGPMPQKLNRQQVEVILRWVKLDGVAVMLPCLLVIAQLLLNIPEEGLRRGRAC